MKTEPHPATNSFPAFFLSLEEELLLLLEAAEEVFELEEPEPEPDPETVVVADLMVLLLPLATEPVAMEVLSKKILLVAVHGLEAEELLKISPPLVMVETVAVQVLLYPGALVAPGMELEISLMLESDAPA